MTPFTVSIHQTTNPKIIKFEANSFLTKYESFEFSNIDDAKNSPLAQQGKSKTVLGFQNDLQRL